MKRPLEVVASSIHFAERSAELNQLAEIILMTLGVTKLIFPLPGIDLEARQGEEKFLLTGQGDIFFGRILKKKIFSSFTSDSISKGKGI